MARNPRYDILFEPVRIGPVTAPQPLLPGAALHRHGLRAAASVAPPARDQGRGRLGRRLHRALLDPSELGRSLRSRFCASWDEHDVRALAHDRPRRCIATARSPASSSWHGGTHAPNRTTPRSAALAAASAGRLSDFAYPQQARAMDKADIRDLPRWQATAARSAPSGRLRHRLCLCRPRLSAAPVPVARAPTSAGRVWRLRSRTARASCAR